MRGLERFAASKAEGQVIFSLEAAQAQDVIIPKGTVVAASEEALLSFETTEDVVIFKGTTSAHATVKAVESGSEFNVKAGAVDAFVTPVSLVTRVTNPDDFEGGSDSEEDESLRKRICDSLKNTPVATNRAFYRNAALSVEGVYDACVVPKGRGAGTVDVYIAAQGAEVTDEVLEKVSSLLALEREVNVDVKVMKASPVGVSYYLQIDVKDGYDFEEVSKNCQQALADFAAKGGVGGKLTLTKAGERVIHVAGVEDYSFDNYINRNVSLLPSQFSTSEKITVVEGV